MKTTVAHVVRVRGDDAFEAAIDLGFGVSLRRLVRIRRKDPDAFAPPPGKSSAANHCLVILIGGKDVLIANYSEDRDVITADVYLTAPNASLPKVDVLGIPGSFVDVAAAMAWASARDFDPQAVRGALR